MKPLAQCFLYGFVDTAYLQGRAADLVATQLCAGGVDLIQLRAKGTPVDEVATLARQVLQVTRRFGVGLVLNDYPALAAELGAEFCHLGQEDFFGAGFTRVDQAQPRGSTVGIGLSTHKPEEAKRAVQAGAEYIAIGPVYATATKPKAQPVTLEYVRWAASNITIPWFAIGGITLENINDVLAAGARRICVVSAILKAQDIAERCRQFKQRIKAVPL